MRGRRASASPAAGRERVDRRDVTASLERLLDGAQATFAARGYHLASVHEICARANVGIGTFYSKFDSKNELLRHLMGERTVPLLHSISPTDLCDVAMLETRLRVALDDPLWTGLWRAWLEGAAEDRGLAEAELDWRRTRVAEITALIVAARGRKPRGGSRLEASAAAWTVLACMRAFVLEDRADTPDVSALARVIHALAFGTTATNA